MPGLSLGAGAQVRARGNLSYADQPAPTTATQAAFGTEAAPAQSSLSAMAPTHPAGITLWAGVFGIGFLLLVYYSLPR